MPVNTQAAGGMGPGVLPNISIPNILPHAGNQQDLNYVMNLLNELSSQVRENRERTDQIVEGVRRIHVRGQTTAPSQPQVADSSEPDGEPNEQPPAESTSDLLARIAELERQNSVLTQERDHARLDAASWENVNEHYQNCLALVNDKVRDYTSQCNQAMFSWHHHYNDLLQKEKDANLAMRLEHSRWQEGLGRALEYSRLALRARTEELEPYEIERAELRTQNKCYRRLLGLSVAESDDEEDDENRSEADETRVEILDIATQKLIFRRRMSQTPRQLSVTTAREEDQNVGYDENRRDPAFSDDDDDDDDGADLFIRPRPANMDGAVGDPESDYVTKGVDDSGGSSSIHHEISEAQRESEEEQDQVKIQQYVVSAGTARALAFGREVPRSWRHTSRSLHSDANNVLEQLQERYNLGSGQGGKNEDLQ